MKQQKIWKIQVQFSLREHGKHQATKNLLDHKSFLVQEKSTPQDLKISTGPTAI